MKAFRWVLCAGDAGIFRACSGCDEVKPNFEFPISKTSADNRFPICKQCSVKRVKEWQKENPDKVNSHSKDWPKNNPEAVKAIRVRWMEANRERERQRAIKYREENREACIMRGRERRKAMSEKARREEIARFTERRRSDPKLRLDHSMSSGVRDSLVSGAKAGRTWESLVGYSVDELRAHLEKLFLPGMSWGNYGRYGWHVDHIIPKSAFNYTLPEHEDFKRCWALSNLRPLWEPDNHAKHAKLPDNGFQPSLAF